MKEEHSAGGLIVKRVDGTWFILLLMDMNNNWTFPKGIIEAGENSKTAAQREILEETGLSSITFHSSLNTISYWFIRNDEKIHKIVDYFLFTYSGNEMLKPQLEEGISELRWMTFADAEKIIGYPKTNIALLQKAENIIYSQLI